MGAKPHLRRGYGAKPHLRRGYGAKPHLRRGYGAKPHLRRGYGGKAPQLGNNQFSDRLDSVFLLFFFLHFTNFSPPKTPSANLYNRSALYNKNIDTYDEGVYCIESRDTSQ